jgi:hypothetical protein
MHELEKLATKNPTFATVKIMPTMTYVIGMNTHNTGYTLILTPSSKPLNLNHILHVPHVTHNLLSMSKVTHDNLSLWNFIHIMFLKRNGP